MLRMSTTEQAITTGIREISEALGGGIRQGSLVIIEGESKTGKSIFSQHLAHGTLNSKTHSVAYYTAEKSLDDLLAQMDDMSLDVRHDFVTDRLRVYTIGPENAKGTPEYLQLLVKHFSELPERFKLIIVDSISPLMTDLSPMIKLDFLQECKELCGKGRSIVLVVDTHILEGDTLTRAHAMSDYYLKLRSKDVMLALDQVETRVIKILEVTKLCGAERHGQEGVNFEIKPKVGIQILPFVTVKA